MTKRTRRTKLICTLGPASRSPEVIRGLAQAGMDVARLNFSYGTRDEHGARIETLRRVEKETGLTIAILQDLGGPKIRIGEFPSGSVRLEPNNEFTLTTRRVPGSSQEVSVSYDALPEEVHSGARVIVGDGLVELEVLETTDTDVRCRVLSGGILSSRKGINLPSQTLSLPALTEKDRKDLEFGASAGVDMVALSYVRHAQEVIEVKEILERHEVRIPVIAKIERHEALGRLEEILTASDACMVARGDLGVDIPLEEVPLLQKSIIREARARGKPVITATQMLASMVESPRPTRAEASDVTNAVLDGTDAVMLSEETAIGKHPLRVVETMDRILRAAERVLPEWQRFVAPDRVPRVPDAISSASCYLAETLDAAAIVVPTQSGTTARLVARHRPKQPILAFSPRSDTVRALNLVWGVTAQRLDSRAEDIELVTRCIEAAKENGFLQAGDVAVITAGVPIWIPGTTNLIRVERVT